MLKFFKNIILIGIVAGFGFYFRADLILLKNQIQAEYFPCKQPISYSLSTFDTRFGISKEYFTEALSDAEEIWETSSSLDLFELVEEGQVKINLIYDERQDATLKLKEMGIVVANNRASYDAIKVEYKNLLIQHDDGVAEFEERINNFEIRKKKYETEVASVNKKGGANSETATRLNSERDYLSKELAIIKQLQLNLNNEVDEINALVVVINQLIASLNIDAEKYNSIGESLPREFDEGVYRSGPEGEEIDIYQFENRTKLVRVLAHELGHALGLDHVDDPKAIMYRLNNGINEKLTATDLLLLNEKCGIK